MKRPLLILMIVLCSLAFAQQKAVPKAPPPVPPGAASATVDETAWPLPLAERDKIRDLQHENDQLEIENQKMLLKIEQNKARQAALIDQEMLIATGFAHSKNLDPAQVELDPAKIVLRKKKAQ